MVLIFTLIIAGFFGLWGYKKGLFAVWPFAFNAILAVYLGLMLTPMVLDLAGEYLDPLGPSANITVMFLITLIYFIIMQFISFICLTKTFCISFPKPVDTIGGAILAFAGGLLITNFILFTIAISPLRDISDISKYLPAGMENSSRGHIINACEFVSTCSLQYGDKNICKAIEIVSRSEPKPSIPVAIKPNPVKSDQTTAAPPKQPKPSRKAIPEVNG
jgi:uncharacterized membrane protein required for colicin V production